MLDFLANSTYERARQAHAAQPEWWVDWHYTEEEWQRWRAADWARTRHIYRRWQLVELAVWGFLAAVMFILFLTGSFATSWPFLLLLTWVLGVGLGANWIFWLCGPYAKAKRLYTLRQQGPREIAITPLWLWQVGEGTPLMRADRVLNGVYLRGEHPAVLTFRLADMLRRSTIYEVRVPVPAGGEADAHQLVERFRQEIIHKPGRSPVAPVAAPPPGSGDTLRLPALPAAAPEHDTQHFPHVR